MNLNKKKNIVFVSISSDLYGSSKLLLTLVLQLKKNKANYNPIVCLPFENGPLKQRLIEEDVEIIEMPVLKLTRAMLKTLSFGSFFKEYKEAKTILESKLNGREVLCVQSNTLATMFGSFYCFRKKTFHIMHVHEIMDRPWFVRYFFSFIQLFFADKIIFNSQATEKFYLKSLSFLKNKSVLIYNGIDRETRFLNSEEKEQLRLDLFQASNEEFLIGLIGRFNRLKGHSLLIDAFAEVNLKHPNTKLCLVGSPPEGQEHFLENVNQAIINKNVSSKTIILPFQEDIYSVIDTLDLVVVPSTEPESFGIIAVEAMLSKKAVIASNLGGLSNIITDQESGLLFEVNNKNELVKSINKMIEDKAQKHFLEENGCQHAKKHFSVSNMLNKFINVYNAI